MNKRREEKIKVCFLFNLTNKNKKTSMLRMKKNTFCMLKNNMKIKRKEKIAMKGKIKKLKK